MRIALHDREITFSGEHFAVDGVGVQPTPTTPVDIWIGGSSAAAYRRIGRYGDGWLGSFLTPIEARDGVDAIRAAAAATQQHVPEDHYGINLAVGNGTLPEFDIEITRKLRPEIDPAELLAASWAELHRQIDGYLDAGLTEFGIRPMTGYDTETFLNDFVREILPRQN